MPEKQTYRIEIRFDFHGTQEEAATYAEQVRSSISQNAEITSIVDEAWEEI